MKIKLDRKFMVNELDLPYAAILNEITGTSRWSIHHRIIFIYQGRFYETYYSEGANADIQKTVIDELSIDERQAELQRLLEEYYQMKLDGLVGSESFKQLESQIQAIQSDILTRYKREIDQVFTQQ